MDSRISESENTQSQLQVLEEQIASFDVYRTGSWILCLFDRERMCVRERACVDESEIVCV